MKQDIYPTMIFRRKKEISNGTKININWESFFNNFQTSFHPESLPGNYMTFKISEIAKVGRSYGVMIDIAIAKYHIKDVFSSGIDFDISTTNRLDMDILGNPFAGVNSVLSLSVNEYDSGWTYSPEYEYGLIWHGNLISKTGIESTGKTDILFPTGDLASMFGYILPNTWGTGAGALDTLQTVFTNAEADGEKLFTVTRSNGVMNVKGTNKFQSITGDNDSLIYFRYFQPM